MAAFSPRGPIMMAAVPLFIHSKALLWNKNQSLSYTHIAFISTKIDADEDIIEYQHYSNSDDECSNDDDNHGSIA